MTDETKDHWGWSALTPGKGYLSDDKAWPLSCRWWSKDIRSCWVCVFDTREQAARYGVPIRRYTDEDVHSGPYPGERTGPTA